MTDALVWIDCEMTGLDLGTDALVEVAALVTDGQLNVLGEGVDILIRPPEEAVAAMSDLVREMHAASGLSEEWASGTTLEDAQAQVLAYVREHVPEPRTAPLAGNTICTDRAFLARDMPELEAYVHYRNVDVSSIKELARRWYPRVYNNSPGKGGTHRALADIRESIEELRFYRETIFTDAPQPTKSEIRAVAHKHSGSISRNDT
jgi:oligoribonuclease